MSYDKMTVETRMTMIPTDELDLIIKYLGRAEYYCSHAKSVHDPDVNPYDPTYTYPGASGYASATCRTILEMLEAHTN